MLPFALLSSHPREKLHLPGPSHCHSFSSLGPQPHSTLHRYTADSELGARHSLAVSFRQGPEGPHFPPWEKGMVPWSSLGIRENVDKVLGMPPDAQEAVAVLSAVTMGLLTSECGVSCVSVACAGLLVTLAFLSCS